MDGVITLFAYKIQRVKVNPNPPQESKFDLWRTIYSFIGGLLIDIIHMYVEPSVMMKKGVEKKKEKKNLEKLPF